MNTEHHFNIKEAERYGVIQAVLLYNIRYWLKKNKANSRHDRDGRIWMYNSVSAFKELFPYLTENQIRHALKKLVEDGILIKDTFNRHNYDRTLWYSIDELEFITDRSGNDDKSISEESQNHLGNFTNGSEKFHEPIPNNKPDNKQQIVNTDTYSLREIAETFLLYWNKRNETRNRLTDKAIKQVQARLSSFTHEEIIEAIDNRSKSDYLKESGHIGNWDSFWRSDSQVDKWLNHKPQSKSIYDIDGEELPF